MLPHVLLTTPPHSARLNLPSTYATFKSPPTTTPDLITVRYQRMRYFLDSSGLHRRRLSGPPDPQTSLHTALRRADPAPAPGGSPPVLIAAPPGQRPLDRSHS